MSSFELLELRQNNIVEISHDNNQEDYCYVVLNGKVMTKQHLLDAPNQFKTVFVAKSGSVLGYKGFDGG